MADKKSRGEDGTLGKGGGRQAWKALPQLPVDFGLFTSAKELPDCSSLGSTSLCVQFETGMSGLSTGSSVLNHKAHEIYIVGKSTPTPPLFVSYVLRLEERWRRPAVILNSLLTLSFW